MKLRYRDNKLDTKIDWIDGLSRYRYILATPDISVKDLVGQIDAIKIIKKGVEIYDIECILCRPIITSKTWNYLY